MKITKISVDERNEQFEVTTEDGKIYGGFRAMNAIRIKEAHTAEGKSLYADLDDDAIKTRLQPKELWIFKNNKNRKRYIK